MDYKGDEFIWTEKYRPRKIEDCILPQEMKDVFLDYVKNGEIPNLLFAGTAGVGKTTVARALCEEVDCDYMFIPASLERGIDLIRNKITSYASSMSMNGNRKVVILDEADNMTPEAQLAFRGAIEEFSSNCSFIFTCNFKNRIIDAIHSRCAVVEFKTKPADKPKQAMAFLKRIEDILDTEKVIYKKPVLAAIVQKYYPDFRRTLNELQRLASKGDIDESVLTSVDEGSIKDLMKAMAEKDFGTIRKWVVNNSDVDISKMYRKIYDALYDYLKPENIPQAVVILADYQYKAAFCADGELNLLACLVDLMANCL